jgi:hypothetical protein
VTRQSLSRPHCPRAGATDKIALHDKADRFHKLGVATFMDITGIQSAVDQKAGQGEYSHSLYFADSTGNDWHRDEPEEGEELAHCIVPDRGWPFAMAALEAALPGVTIEWPAKSHLIGTYKGRRVGLSW